MTDALGFKGGILMIGEPETTYGTAVTRTKGIRILSDSINKDQAVLETASLNESFQDSDDIAAGRVSVGGEISTELRYSDEVGTLMRHVLGSAATTGPTESVVYTHTIKLADTQPVGISLEVDADVKGKLIAGGKINSMTLAGEADGFMTMSLGIVGKDMTLITPTTGITLPVESLIAFPAIAVTYAGSPILCDSFSIQLNNNLITERYKLNSQTIIEPLRGGKPEITGSFTLDFATDTQFAAFVAQTKSALVVTATGAVITGTTPYSLTITLPQIVLTSATPMVSDAGLIKVECSFKAFATDTNTREMTIVLVNTATTI